MPTVFSARTPVAPITSLSPLPEQIVDAFIKFDHRRLMSLIDRISAADTEWQGEIGNTILHMAVARDDTQAALKIIEKASLTALNLKNEMGETPLATAVWRANVPVISALKRHMPTETFQSERDTHLQALEQDKVFLEAHPRLSPSERERLDRIKQSIEILKSEESSCSLKKIFLSAFGWKG